MTIYGYQCRECGQEYTSEYQGSVLMEECECCGIVPKECICGTDQPIKRKYSLSTIRGMEPHFNQSVGKEISSDRQFRDELKRKSDAEFARTGIPCQYEPIDPEESLAAVVGSDAQGLESTNRARVNEGKKPIRIPGLI